MKSLIKKQEGFTLIEIVLVLAIAAFIILMVFLALRGAQQAQRDTQRKQAGASFVAYVEQLISNSNGVVPATVTTWTSGPNSPDNAPYLLSSGTTASSTADSIVYTGPGYVCTGSTATITGASPATFAVLVTLQTGSACFDNQNH